MVDSFSAAVPRNVGSRTGGAVDDSVARHAAERVVVGRGGERHQDALPSRTGASGTRVGRLKSEAKRPDEPPLTVLIAHHPVIRAGIRIMLEAEVCAEASSGDEAIRAAKREQPDVCLVGRELCGDGMRIVQGICRAAPTAAVVVLAADSDVDDCVDSIRAGAVGYMPGAMDAERVRLVLRAIAAREAVVPRSMVLELVLELQGGREGLTARESQVRRLLRRGYTTREIAGRLGVSSTTVRRHISDMVQKLGVEDRAALTTPQSEFGATMGRAA